MEEGLDKGEEKKKGRKNLARMQLEEFSNANKSEDDWIQRPRTLTKLIYSNFKQIKLIPKH